MNKTKISEIVKDSLLLSEVLDRLYNTNHKEEARWLSAHWIEFLDQNQSDLHIGILEYMDPTSNRIKMFVYVNK